MVYGLDSLIHLLSPYVHKNQQQQKPAVDAAAAMDVEEFRKVGKQMVDYVADYMENIAKRRVVPSIEPGYLRRCLPKTAPDRPESFEQVLKDVESYIMPGVTHWQHPRFHAYFPAGNSFPSILADMLSDAIGCVGFSWAASPACTELEMIMLDWFGQMIGLPKEFLPFTEHGRGGGVIQGSASECILVSLLAARFEIIKGLKVKYPFVEEGILLSKLIAYCSKEAHSSVEKACMIGLVKLRILETDRRFRLRGETVKAAIAEDRNLGLIPFFVSTTLGTTSCCSFDVLSEIGPVCRDENIWLHVDAAYAGSAFICPEFKPLMNGIEYAMSFNTNPNKWMLVSFDCSTMWVKDRFKLTQALVVDPLYLQHGWMDKAIDYRHWGIPLSRRFRSLKLWFVIRMYGVEGLQRYIREHVRLAKKFEQLLKTDNRFEISNDVILGLVCFRLRTSNEINQKFLTKINASGKLHMVPASVNDKFIIRFCVCAERATDKDIFVAFEIIRQIAGAVLVETAAKPILAEEEEEEEEDQEKQSGKEMKHREKEGLPMENGVDEDREDDEKDSSTCSRKSHTLAEKRSFFVRMVSDPKCYNPKIVRTLTTRQRKLSDDVKRDFAIKMDIACSTDESSDNEQQQQPSCSSQRLSVGSCGDKTSIKEEEDGDVGKNDDRKEEEEEEDVFVSETGIVTPM